MTQMFKAVYYPDYQKFHSSSRSLTIAFSQADRDVFEAVRHLSSEQIRRLLGASSYADLIGSATSGQRSMNSYCISKMRDSFGRQPEGTSPPLAIDPLQATFRGGAAEPGHNWYSYLEGYSPQFVRHVVEEFAPSARSVYDPFSGVGTTPMTVGGLGLRAYYSELNPFLRDLVETKFAVRVAPEDRRAEIAAKLRALSTSLEDELASVQPDARLRDAYISAFGKSRFFDDETLDAVLRARTLVDSVLKRDVLIGDLLTTAISNSLVPASLLQRAGDIRYKSARELERRPSLVGSVRLNLQMIASDVPLMHPLPIVPCLMSTDAKAVGDAPVQQIDAVVTSPPYLNGTNYFRNTKIELWFTRHVENAEDLAAFRRLAVTAGINDVSKDKGRSCVHETIANVVEKLESSAYDKRIPRMVAQYFTDMAKVFEGLRRHLTTGAVVAIDIGDSIYAGTHVATDRLLVDVLGSLGYRLSHDVTLRTRSSYNGAVLRQALLVFEYGRSRHAQN